MKLFVAGLPYDLYDDELVEIFEKFGKIVSAKVAMDKETGKSRGFAFVEMENEQDAKDAIEHLNDISLGKKPLVVKEAGDQGGGGFGGGNRGGGYNKGGGGGYNKGGGGYNSGGGYNRGGGYNKGGGGGYNKGGGGYNSGGGYNKSDDGDYKPRNRY
jgi:RNA recognition motif-containing protein